MRKTLKKSLALMMVASMLLPSSVTAKESAPIVGRDQAVQSATSTDTYETPPTTSKQQESSKDVPATVPTTEEKTEATKSTPSETEVPKVETTEKVNATKQTKSETVSKANTTSSTSATDKVDNELKETEIDSVKDTNEPEQITKELLIKADKESDLPSNGTVLSSYEDTYLVSFPNTKAAEQVYKDKNTDASLNIPFGIATNADTSTSATAVEPEVLDNLEEVIKSDDEKDASFKISDDDYSIAVIDTGMPKTEKNVEFVSMLGDEGYDEHGHGTSMLKSIREQDKDAKILSIKALGKNGSGDAATIYAAIEYAIERNVNVINLSISGYATEGNKIIEDAIKEAVSKGIVVVGAAGNDNLPASAFIPGGIDEIIVVGACDDKNQRKSFSNYGITVDYYANASSTSEAAAIVTGTISANSGDVAKLDDIFFKTPDLSIFEEDLKKSSTTTAKDVDEDEINDDDNTGQTTSHEEFLLRKLYKFVDRGGDFYVADAAYGLADGGTLTVHEDPYYKEAFKNAYKDSLHCYAVNTSLIDKTKATISSTYADVDGTRTTNPQWKIQNYFVWFAANEELQDGYWVVYQLEKADTATHTITSDLTITIPGCVVDLTDGSLHDWQIHVEQMRFRFAPHTGNDEYKHSRRDLIGIKLRNGRPFLTTGAADNDNEPFTKVDSRTEVWFSQSVVGAPAGSVLLTGFSDLDQEHEYPLGGNGDWYYEGIRINDVNTLGSRDIWVRDDYTLDISDVNNYPSGVRIESPVRDDGSGNRVVGGTEQTTFLYAASATGATHYYWDGVRCQTGIGLSLADLLPKTTVNTYVRFQGADGNWSDYTLANGPVTENAGTVYTYTYNGAGIDLNVYDYAGTAAAEPNTAAYFNGTNKTITYTMMTDTNFYLQVPRRQYTYNFDPNPPAGKTAANIASMPDSITKYAGNICGNYNRTPTLADYEFMGFFDTPAATGGNAYNPNEVMLSNKTFYARWKPYHTYYFHDNKPANATSNVTNMPDNIRKLEGSICGNYNRTPNLKGWIFRGFYDTNAATGGNAYNPNEVMNSDKHFYARWEPMKYYVRYNGNGATNFNENATNGMQAGEYTQNTVTGNVAYQVFTYDTIGEALRANGFTRRGYTYVCWNMTATRTGNDYDPGYVKPANVNWIKGDGTDPTATLDGTNTYPVVDLYAVWRQKLGTETLTVVSEETGKPVANVNVTLTNTSNNTQRATGITNAQGQVTVTGLHWFPYSWASTAVPAGYKAMQAVPFSINPANSPANETFLNVNNTRILYMKHVKLTLNSVVDDIIKGEDAPAFMYHITGTDVAGVQHSYDVMVQTDVGTKKGTNIVPVNSGDEEPYMFAGNYTVTQYDVSRYVARNAQNVANTTPVGQNANANLTNNDSAEVTFPYGIKQYGGFSGVHSLINKLTK